MRTMLWAVAASALLVVACESTSPDGKVPFKTVKPRAPIQAPHGGDGHDSHAAAGAHGEHEADVHAAAKGEDHGHGAKSAAHAAESSAHAAKAEAHPAAKSAHEAGEAVAETAGAHAQAAAETASDHAEAAAETASDHAEAAAETASDHAEAAAETASAHAEAAAETAEAHAESAASAVETAEAAAKAATETTQAAAETAKTTATETAAVVGEKVGEAAQAAAETAKATATETAPAVSPALMKKGKKVFTANCVACHQLTGQGLAGAFPPLVDSEWVLGDPARPVAIVLQGLMGEIEVKGKKYNNVMAGLGAILKDKDVAAVVTYVRNSWGNSASPVDQALVKKIRAKLKGKGMWKSPAEVTAFAKSL